MPTSYVALLRGINVGKAKRLSMADLRAVLERLGCDDVATVGVSGNAVFRSSRTEGAMAAAIEEAIRTELATDVRVLVRSVDRVREVMAANPLPDEAARDPSRFHVSFALDGELDRAALRAVLGADWSPEALAVGEGVLYLWHPDGMTGSRLGEALARIPGAGPSTVRNWATLTKVVAKAV
ncbi:MAG TPA: DUF1697 domain-containing protein [Acidimicrobiales bacterium]|nr:DUF1697 domain-containing protein [Acidimicrobiales bacterium]